MKKHFFFFFFLFVFYSCKKETPIVKGQEGVNEIQYANGFALEKYEGFSLLKVHNTWANSNENYVYVLRKAQAVVPDSLKKYTVIQVPVNKIVVTSTTHIPSLEMLGTENTLVAFPNCNYISSEKTRVLIDAGKVKEVGDNQSLNTEMLLDIAPDVIVGIGMDNASKTFAHLEKNGLKVLYNGDWAEQSPLGKAEWVKFFGALYDADEKATVLFNNIVKEYNHVKQIALQAKLKPTVMSGAIYQDFWYLPQGKSWGAQFIKDANAHYIWEDTNGTGSLSLSFEEVLDKAQDADFWIGPSQFSSYSEMMTANTNYKHFKAFENKKVYSYSAKKGRTGGIIYYELASNHPDWVLKDLVKIFHPELLPDYELFFLEPLK